MMVEESERIWKEKKKTINVDIEKWRKYWRKAGPIRFAQEYLFCYPQVPSYPNWQKYQTEAYCKGCKKIHKKFHENGIPVHIILSEDQIEVLEDAWKNGVRCILISAGRGAGKTFILAIWNTWKLCTEDYYEITSMGGSQGQSKLLQKYIDFWRAKHREIGFIINVSRKAIGDRCCETRMGGLDSFVPCSETAVRGPHVNEVQADEACAAESRGIEGEEAIEAIDWEITGRRDTYTWLTSTSHYLLGKFYKIYRNPKRYGFKRYIWAIAKHKSGKPAFLMYKDRNPKNWEPAVWWITQESIEKLRRRKSNESWLCEALGRASLASGAVFRPNDLNACICDLCPEDDCEPYKWGKCKLIEKYGLGDRDNPTKYIKNRKGGFDYGDPAPCAFIIGGTKGQFIFILSASEQKGITTPELIGWLERELLRWDTSTINIPDSVGGQHVREILEDKEYNIVLLEEQYKEERVQNIKNIVEKHSIIIPPAFWHLTESLKGMHRDKRGKIVKRNDHCYSDDTEILTENGWKLFKDLQKNEKIATLTKNGKLEYQRPTEYIEEKFEGKMFTFENNSISFMVSPNHRMAYIHQYDYKNNNYRIDLSDIPNLPQNIFIPKVAISWKGNEEEFIEIPSVSNHSRTKQIQRLPMDKFLAFLGIWLAEGCTSKEHYKVIIDQNKDKEWKIKKIFDELGLIYHRRETGLNRVRYSIQSINLYHFFKKFGRSWEKFIPNWVFRLSKRQQIILYENMMFGDGSKSRNSYHYDTVSKRLADDFQRLLLHIGLVGRITPLYYNYPKHRISYRISIWQSKNAFVYKRDIKKEYYKGNIYCIKVPNHIIYVRRNGKPMWSSNSFDALCYLCIDWGGLEGSPSEVFDLISEEIEGKKLSDINEEKEDIIFSKKSKGIKFWEN